MQSFSFYTNSKTKPCFFKWTLALFVFLIFPFNQSIGQFTSLQNLQIQHIGVEHGLSQGSIYSIYKDSRQQMWFSSNEGLNRYDGFEVTVYQNSSLDSNSLQGNYTNGIVEDGNGNLWVGSEVCLNRYVRKHNHFDFVYAQNKKGKEISSTNYPFYADDKEVWYTNSKEGVLIYNFQNGEKRIVNDSFFYNRTNYMINSTFRTQDGSIWIRREIGIARIHPGFKKTSFYFSNHPENILGEPKVINCFYQRRGGEIIMGAGSQLLEMNKSANAFKLLNVISESGSTISEIREDENGLLWLGTEQDGLIVYSMEKGIIKQFTTKGSETQQLTNNSVAALHIDDQGSIWVNVDPEGIDLVKRDFKAFKVYKGNLFIDDDFSSRSTKHFAEQADGKIWIVTEKDGLCLFDPDTEKIVRRIHPLEVGLFDGNENYVFIDSHQRTLIGSYNGFYYFDQDEDNYKRVINQTNPAFKSSSNFIWRIIKVPDENVLFSTEAGVFYFDQNIYEPKPLFGLDKSTAQLHLDDKGRLLISEYHQGFHVINYDTWKNEDTVNSEKWSRQFLSDYNIKCFYQNKPHSDYWIGTHNGLLHVYPNEEWTAIDSLKRYSQEHGLPSVYIYGILPDENNRLWLSTNRGLAALDLQTMQFKSYVLEDGVQGYEFNTNSYMKASTGEMYFGGTNGFNRFDPRKIKTNPTPPLSVELTGFFTNGKSNQEQGYIGELQKIKLPYSQNTFTINYAAIDYLSSGQNKYELFLEGYDDDWQQVGAQRSVRYTGVPEGNYTFHVNACNRDGVWTNNPRQLTIRITPPWYRTWWAYMLYAFLTGLILYTIYDYQNRRRLLQHQLELEQKEAERLKEIDQFKTRIYTNITHEFRTPLTVIKGMSENMEEGEARNLIQRNSDNLLSLVNQMLDLSKLESGSIPLHLENGNILAFLKYLLESFQSMAVAKNIQLSFHSDLENFEMAFDQDKLSKVMSNLLINAIKFTPENGKVSMEVTKDNEAKLINIKLKDTGKGIAKNQQHLIFDRFYQIEGQDAAAGTGIGLAIVKELTEIQGGNIWVDSIEGKGSVFYLTLPIQTASALSQLPNTETASLTATAKTNKINSISEGDELPQLLIIEDNYDVVQYMKIILEQDYTIAVAHDGEAGIQTALETIPDLIISDVMMPEKDGFEVCATLKQDEKTSHIPIILLTAKAASVDKLTGLSYGADAYLVKPFEREELLIRLEQLLALRKKLQTRYILLNGEPAEEKPKTIEDEFLQKIQNKLLSRIEDDTYSIDHLAADMQLSRSQLYRKIKALTNLSTSIYIRNIRLRQAQKLLLEGSLSVSEVAYQVGFNSPAYFSQAYKEAYGYAPNQEGK